MACLAYEQSRVHFGLIGLGWLRVEVVGLLVAPWLFAEIPQGTMLPLRLLTPVSSRNSHIGDEVRAIVVPPGRGALIARGAVVRGKVTGVRKVGLGLVHETAKLKLSFEEIEFPDGQRWKLQARLTAVDNARERVDATGAIRGIRATASLSHRCGFRLAVAAMSNLPTLIPVFALQSSLFRFPDPEINYSTGTDLYLVLESPIAVTVEPRALPTVTRSAVQQEELVYLIDRLPLWSYSKRLRTAMDPVNLVFLGTDEQIDRAFAAAGWTGSQPMSAASVMEVTRAIAEVRGYGRAPMRTLLLDGEAPTRSMQKALNTFTRRHHLRIWRHPETLGETPVWVSAATRDIGAGFSVRPFGFTHRIESDVDLERDKVVADLLVTGCVDGLNYVSRSSGRSWERKRLNTDGEVAVVLLNSCIAPWHLPAREEDGTEPGWAARLIRRLVLSGRNRLLRDNTVWRAGDAGWTAIRVAKRLCTPLWRRSVNGHLRCVEAKADVVGSSSFAN